MSKNDKIIEAAMSGGFSFSVAQALAARFANREVSEASLKSLKYSSGGSLGEAIMTLTPKMTDEEAAVIENAAWAAKSAKYAASKRGQAAFAARAAAATKVVVVASSTPEEKVTKAARRAFFDAQRAAAK